MAKMVRYVAAEGQGAVTVSGRRFRPGDVRSVPDALAKELISGSSEHLANFKFEEAKEQRPEKSEVAAAPEPEPESTTGSDT